MAKSLVIVESPAKAKTVNHYLGEDYVVKASMGHVRDLPKKQLGVDVKISRRDQPNLSAIARAAAKAHRVSVNRLLARYRSSR